MSLLRWIFPKIRRRKTAIERGYHQIVQQARQPHLYEQAGIPDTKEGRFDMLVLHAILLFHRLAEEGKEPEAYGQAVFNHMIRDLEGNLRSIGISDLAVPRHIKMLARSFYGRVKAYRDALESEDAGAVRDVIARNLLGVDSEDEADSANIDTLVAYLHQQVDHLGKQDVSRIVEGDIEFHQHDREGRAT